MAATAGHRVNSGGPSSSPPPDSLPHGLLRFNVGTSLNDSFDACSDAEESDSDGHSLVSFLPPAINVSSPSATSIGELRGSGSRLAKTRTSATAPLAGRIDSINSISSGGGSPSGVAGSQKIPARSFSPRSPHIPPGVAAEADPVDSSNASRTSANASGSSLKDVLTVAKSAVPVTDLPRLRTYELQRLPFGQLPSGLLLRKASVQAHTKRVSSIRANPFFSGRYATAGYDGMIKCFSLTSELGQYPQAEYEMAAHSGAIRGIAWHPDGLVLASVGMDNTVQLWNKASRTASLPLRGPGYACDISLSGEHLIVSSLRYVYVYDIETTKLLQSIEAHDLNVYSCCYHPASLALLMTASDDQTIKLWDVENGLCVQTFSDHRGYANTCAFSANGHLLLSGGNDGAANVYVLGQDAPLFSLTDARGPIFATQATDSTIYTAGSDTVIRAYSAETGDRIRSLHGHIGTIHDLAVIETIPTLATDDTVGSAVLQSSSLLLSGGVDLLVCQWNLSNIAASLDAGPDGENGVNALDDSADMLRKHAREALGSISLSRPATARDIEDAPESNLRLDDLDSDWGEDLDDSELESSDDIPPRHLGQSNDLNWSNGSNNIPSILRADDVWSSSTEPQSLDSSTANLGLAVAIPNVIITSSTIETLHNRHGRDVSELSGSESVYSQSYASVAPSTKVPVINFVEPSDEGDDSWSDPSEPDNGLPLELHSPLSGLGIRLGILSVQSGETRLIGADGGPLALAGLLVDPYLEISVADQVVWTDSPSTTQDGHWATFFEFDDLHPRGESMSHTDFDLRLALMERRADGTDAVVDAGSISLWALDPASISDSSLADASLLGDPQATPIRLKLALDAADVVFTIGIVFITATGRSHSWSSDSPLDYSQTQLDDRSDSNASIDIG
ncbi:atypical/Alpha/MHCK protein kinase [Thecamonas trahens ATCC 50062]|uniref:Atypical/Alpha/MHCK protein kinase n=1 Tax=Thecamonas trahens ATCC 50062 TaxID=461836 RepID=A0A0L0D547_THETB|nr:atypical/Alpha/MHCK protein kinase [Thecamonas trahens ATCC 50062]KNC47370.1 atypical/Alpha/MHCK protein kinase [Thecamonas trahens ATCC 50062]|eukprot:XP_013759708.1 atypical/Alpha/MHCK protein kinase [Thecamonas trahens ATCC 50062]